MTRVMKYMVLISALLVTVLGLSFAEENETSFDEVEEMAVAYLVEISDANWSEEWVEIANLGESAQNMTGWILQDLANHTYEFPMDFVLVPEASVNVYTFEGNDTTADLYMNRARAIWNDDGDTAILLDEMGIVVDIYPDEVIEDADENAVDE